MGFHHVIMAYFQTVPDRVRLLLPLKYRLIFLQVRMLLNSSVHTVTGGPFFQLASTRLEELG